MSSSIKSELVDEAEWEIVDQPRVWTSRMSALLIGVNDYTSSNLGIKSLHCAEADALAWRDFLEQDLGVPDSRIKMLLGQSATGKCIIGAFNKLANDPNIMEGDPILIFFAGHGAQIQSKTSAVIKETIEVIVPADGKSIEDLCIAQLIDQIAEKKGDNITVIMDCCHSASATRGDEDTTRSERLVRGIGMLSGSSVAGFWAQCAGSWASWAAGSWARNIVSRPPTASSDYSRVGLKSHMLLAACCSDEKAHESNGHGEFTHALLPHLRGVQHIDKLKYSDIFSGMNKITNQTPQCIGVNSDRIIFNGNIISRPPMHYKVKFIAANEDLGLEAGSIHGVTIGAKFDIYAEGDTSLANIIGVATVKDVTASSATMTYSPSLALKELCPYYALQVKPEKPDDFSLFIPRGDTFRALFDEVGGGDLISTVDDENSTPESYMQVSTRETHKVTFELKGRRLAQYGFKKQFAPIDGNSSDEVERVLKGIAHYYRELNRKSPESGLQNDINLEFYRLGPNASDDPWQKFVPKSPNYFQGGVIDFEVTEKAPYGIKLINNSDRDLYPYLFYFNNDDLSIVSIHDTPPANHISFPIEAPLKKKSNNSGGILTLGYGSSGVPPWMYTMGQESRHVDFLKIIFTTQPIDVSSICAPSFPFKEPRGAVGAFPDSLGPQTDEWYAKCVTYILRQPESKTNQ